MPQNRNKPIFEILDLAYRVDMPKREWLREVAGCIYKHRHIGEGVLAYELDISGGKSRPGELISVEATEGIREFARNTGPLHRSLRSGVYHEVLKNGTDRKSTRLNSSHYS